MDILATELNTPIMATNEKSDETDYVVVIPPSAFVGAASTVVGLAEEWPFDYGGAPGGVAYNNKHKTDSKFVTLGDDAIMLKELPDDNAPLDVPGLVTIA